VTVGSVLCH